MAIRTKEDYPNFPSKWRPFARTKMQQHSWWTWDAVSRTWSTFRELTPELLFFTRTMPQKRFEVLYILHLLNISNGSVHRKFAQKHKSPRTVFMLTNRVWCVQNRNSFCWRIHRAILKLYCQTHKWAKKMSMFGWMERNKIGLFGKSFGQDGLGGQPTFRMPWGIPPLPTYGQTLKMTASCSRYDARVASRNASSWSAGHSRGGFGARALFDAHSVTPAQLLVSAVRRGEQGLYRCRVDFRTAQTRNAFVNLSIIGESKSEFWKSKQLK